MVLGIEESLSRSWANSSGHQEFCRKSHAQHQVSSYNPSVALFIDDCEVV